MNYQETLDFMFGSLPMFQRQGKAAYKANLDNSIAFDKYLSYPHKAFKSIHIAGTNGKGSSSHMLASILQEEGYKVGLYTSPHLKDFRERIKVNGQLIEQDFVVRFIEQIQDFIKDYQPSFFEMTVFMAFQYFKVQNVDIAVIETGMGGRLDSTNLIQPLVSVITNISLDHTQFLGDSIEKIAVEKAGIIKKNTPVIVGESNEKYNWIFENKALENKATCTFADQEFRILYALKTLDSTQVFDIYKGAEKKYQQLEIDLLGHYQQRNTITVISTIAHLPFFISEDSIYRGLKNTVKNTRLLGRWQILGHNPQVVCDTGHNEAGIRLVLEQIQQQAYDKLHIVWGMVNDKSIDKIMALLPKEANYYFTKAKIPRALDENELYELAQKYFLKGEKYSSVSDALETAKQLANKNDLIFIGGSTFVVAEVL